MTYLLLFYEFFKAGLFAIGGGLATLPFLYDMADKYPWFTRTDLANMIAVSESTPGPIGVNMATYAGYTTGGIFGALIYGVATTLSWNVMEGVNYPVMGVAAALTIVFSVLVVLAVDNWAQVIWVPLFILLAAILAFVITSGQMLGSITLGLVFALILCYHFLRWMILPALVSTSNPSFFAAICVTL